MACHAWNITELVWACEMCLKKKIGGKNSSGCSACLLGIGEWFSGSPLVLRMTRHAVRGKVNEMNIFDFG